MQRTPGAGSCLCQDRRAIRLATSPPTCPAHRVHPAPGTRAHQHLPPQAAGRSGRATHRPRTANAANSVTFRTWVERNTSHRGCPVRRSGCACPPRAATFGPACPSRTGRGCRPPARIYALRQPRPRLARPPAPLAGKDKLASEDLPCVASTPGSLPRRHPGPCWTGRRAHASPEVNPVDHPRRSPTMRIP